MTSLGKAFPQQVDKLSAFLQYRFYLLLAMCMCILEEGGHRKYDNCYNQIIPVIIILVTQLAGPPLPDQGWNSGPWQ